MQNGYDVKRAVEFDAGIANTYKENHPEVDVIVDDIRNVDNSSVFHKDETDIIIGGPPCQGFSMAGARIREGFINDPRNFLFKHYFNVVKNVKPKAFVFENVKGILTMENGEIFREIMNIFSNVELLDGQPYYLNYRVVRAVEFGLPQKRERVIIVGIRNPNINFDDVWNETRENLINDIPTFFNPVTVRDAIGNLPPVTDDGIIPNPTPQTDYQRYLSCNNETLTNHNKTHHSALAISRMSRVRNGENFTVLHEDIKSVHSGSYGRLSWDDVAPTITTRFDTPSGGRFTHPDENRTLSPREAARIQSFPDNFIFHGNRTTICKQIGNAVPPKISYFLARLIANILRRGE